MKSLHIYKIIHHMIQFRFSEISELEWNYQKEKSHMAVLQTLMYSL